ncbi:hypothetical protein EG346_20080 [Chryseobacterium carnipullorum]|uniref:Uncharacterized protein n=1 Tax=Chryseobacterium carnipullorum TaxID=1124835 RepID=A0A376DZ97_CHRCU|nr:hypothetical protein EG346_20080 [Chryseobacterium carnipullorum]AZA65207.1 hypothetical protein EG345_11135 [Chryseobacterium carnipullorum]STC98734.1 Uncharacterised protein [Chryseobacterium carnipullorum]
MTTIFKIKILQFYIIAGLISFLSIFDNVFNVCSVENTDSKLATIIYDYQIVTLYEFCLFDLFFTIFYYFQM